MLIQTAREVVESGMIRRHDVAGRVFHRLLDSRKFLATNYTTIPAAILLAGSLLDKRDAEKMKKALRKTLDGTAASLYAGLGSAFVVLADEALDIGGRMAFVLPATMLTGSRWAPIRRLLLSKYAVEWVVVSHDARNRSAKKGLPGRLLVSFSESTRMAEALIVATRRESHDLKGRRACFVNLLRNPGEPIEALALTRKLLALRYSLVPLEPTAIDIGDATWGNAALVPQGDLPLDGGPWSLATFAQPELALVAKRIAFGKHVRLGSVPVGELGELADFGPYEMQIKNPKQGLFTIRERPMEATDPEWELRAGFPALWRHKGFRNRSLEARADSRLERRADRSSGDQDRMLARRGRLQLARELRYAPQRMAAVMTDNPMLGVRSWYTVLLRSPASGKNEALCLWLNSTFGLLLRIMHGNRPYLGRSAVPHPSMSLDRWLAGWLVRGWGGPPHANRLTSCLLTLHYALLGDQSGLGGFHAPRFQVKYLEDRHLPMSSRPRPRIRLALVRLGPLSRAQGQLARPSRDDLRQASISSRGTQEAAFVWISGGAVHLAAGPEATGTRYGGVTCPRRRRTGG